jgi:hypothetical protein
MKEFVAVVFLTLASFPAAGVPCQPSDQRAEPKLTNQEKENLKVRRKQEQLERKKQERMQKLERDWFRGQQQEWKRAERERERATRYTPAWITTDHTMEETRNALVYKLTARGYGIAADTTYQLSFWTEVTGTTGFLTQLLLGNAYSETPKQIITFTLVPREGQVTVRGTGLVMVRMPLGNVNTVDVTYNGNFKRDVQGILDSLFEP